ncbi:GlmU family protein [Flavobacteriaceae bacterium 14752]|uniref:GlmU family protein n=1 Tax=Mesohalobacter salilacus TaxID=2491711 RepID=UPI000F63E55A|nr:glucose-1-phosphate thymidylyltransferase [Flavobacteriaceae bacterium 14752]
MNVVFIEPYRSQLLPLSYTKPVSELRCGILKMKEKWEKHCPSFTFSNLTEDYLSEIWPLHIEGDNLFLNASVFPNKNLVDSLIDLKPNQALSYNNDIIAYRSGKQGEYSDAIKYDKDILILKNTWDIFKFNHTAIKDDFDLLTRNKKSEPLPEHIVAINPGQIFIEPGAKLINGTLNASEGPIYIGNNSEIMESVNIRGPFALCDHAVVKMGAKIYTGTTIGPFSKVGGEVSNSVIQGFSNKGHDGFLGNSVIGEWCNLGADTNTSNLKNNYASVKLWDYNKQGFADTGLQFCGLIMGDHSKCGINTMFNTGTVVGVSANIFGEGFPRNFIPSFSWGGKNGFMTYKFEKAIEVAEVVMKRRNIKIRAQDIKILEHVFEISQEFRRR